MLIDYLLGVVVILMGIVVLKLNDMAKDVKYIAYNFLEEDIEEEEREKNNERI